jgi:hypothetical protein
LSSWALQRISNIKSEQDDLDKKLFLVLAGTNAHKEALDELKTMFAKYVGKFGKSDDSFPSM